MCGIVGVLGSHQAAPILVEGLKKLEYRGYDSAGIATVSDGELDRRRAMGKLVNLNDLLMHEPLTGTSGIGHTRWATHGAANTNNAHPHRRGKVAIVHNGIIENFRQIREHLAEHQINPETETDTETVAMLCNWHLDQGKSHTEAAIETVNALEGAYALCFLFDGEQDLIVAARKGSPLAIGWGNNEMFVGSDALALSGMTNEVTYLDEGDIAIVSRSGAQLLNENREPVERPRKTVSLDITTATKAGHKHFMSKEIAEQPAVLGDAISYYHAEGTGVAQINAELDFTAIDRLTMVACGTASLACHVSKYWFERIARLPVEIDVASEFRYREPPLHTRDMTLFVSQSGETADTLAAMRYCHGKAGKVVSVVNVAESTIARESDLALPILAGVEIGVASTKAFTCQLIALATLAIEAAVQRGEINETKRIELIGQLTELPRLLDEALACEKDIHKLAMSLAKKTDALFLGRGAMYPLALEGALKLKEISYIHAEGYASGELKHGPIALIDEDMPVIVLAPRDELFEKTVSNMQEVMARGGQVVLISDADGIAEASEGIWQSVQMPKMDPLFAPVVYSAAVQLLAYHTAVEKGTDVDQPRNLAKSVTVE
ncbi:MAG: glutamine--fructose-6-phosphate transaminase (isomerizing) [Paracoccaceae bacterium]|nr:glutamine--fructose-6-phosphate transaminase (isomerizing) [Paracoccaceae bacterium]MDG2260073.1 glutamine--fructose-6-phosphate transaminase (isomerizing) [Paracoccaceae bacterium]